LGVWNLVFGFIGYFFVAIPYISKHKTQNTKYYKKGAILIANNIR